MSGRTLESTHRPLHLREREFRSQAFARSDPGVDNLGAHPRQCRRRVSTVLGEVLDQERQDVQLSHGAELSGHLAETPAEFPRFAAIQPQERKPLAESPRRHAGAVKRLEIPLVNASKFTTERVDLLLKRNVPLRYVGDAHARGRIVTDA